MRWCEGTVDKLIVYPLLDLWIDDIVKGIAKFKKEFKKDIPIFIRMYGTKEEIGKQLMRNDNIPVYDSLYKATIYRD